jgi:hypothetical protein
MASALRAASGRPRPGSDRPACLRRGAATRASARATTPQPSLFIFGLGYLGEGFARLALADGW